MVLATFALMIGTNKEAQVIQITETTQEIILNGIPYIHYLVLFQKNKANIQALINSSNKVNMITLAYIFKLGLKVQKLM